MLISFVIVIKKFPPLKSRKKIRVKLRTSLPAASNSVNEIIRRKKFFVGHFVQKNDSEKIRVVNFFYVRVKKIFLLRLNAFDGFGERRDNLFFAAHYAGQVNMSAARVFLECFAD